MEKRISEGNLIIKTELTINRVSFLLIQPPQRDLINNNESLN